MIPIFENTIYSANADTLIYTINVNDVDIFSGKAYAYPNSNIVNININKICENYLKMNLPVMTLTGYTGTWTNTDSFKTFTLNNSATTVLATYTFYWNWSYEPTSEGVISKPINGRYTADMYKLRTTLGNSSITNEYNKTSTPALGYTESGCGDYAIYYINRYGGADSFLVENKVIEKDAFTTYTYTTYLDEGIEREDNRYMNEITHTYEISTGWLTDEQSATVAKHLFSSNYVYIHNLKTDTIVPVDITDKNVEYKTFKNERKLINYKIKFKESNKKIIL